MLPDLFLPSEADEPQPNADVYPITCKYALTFFDAHLNSTDESLAFLEHSPADVGIDPGRVTLRRMAGLERPPTQDEFMAMLQEGHVDTAVALYEKFTAAESDLVLFPEANMNMMGYRYLQQGMVPQAIMIFRLNAESHPQSANCWDSLTEAYIANGDNEHALECVQKVIEVLPNDTNLSDDLRQALEHNAQRYMEMLGPESE
jgi:tetratricopeptide (TPR) repeat protein